MGFEDLREGFELPVWAEMVLKFWFRKWLNPASWLSLSYPWHKRGVSLIG
jgi:hypothetical protein